MSNSSNTDQCALDANGKLLPADRIEFRHDPDDPNPLPVVSEDAIMRSNREVLGADAAAQGPEFLVDSNPSTARRRSGRNRAGNLMSYLIAEEKRDEHDKLKPRFAARTMTRSRRATKRSGAEAATQQIAAAEGEEVEDDDDDEYSDSGQTESDDGASLTEGIDNEELADALAPKTQASRKRTGTAKVTPAPKRARSNVTVEEVDDEDAPGRPLQPSLSTSSTLSSPGSSAPHASTSRSKTTNPIYYFYEKVDADASGNTQDGARYYRCYHGTREIKKVTRAMKFNTKHMVEHIMRNFPAQYQVYLALKDPNRSTPPTELELAIASGKTNVNDPAAQDYFKILKSRPHTIVEAFENQNKAEWNQADFEKALIQWIIACDQPFDEVEKPEFQNMLQYTHSSFRKPLKIPGRSAVRRRVMKMGEDSIEEIRRMFADLKSKVSLSLDNWTSENQYAFMAIVAHYITNDGALEELLIDFRELVGPHTGENMHAVVWQTIKLYGLEEKIFAIVMDNATNNDKMMEFLERRFKEINIRFSAKEARMRCMPHIVHLAALELLEGIGAMNSTECAAAAAGYQDVVSDILSDNTTDDDNGDELDGEGSNAGGAAVDPEDTDSLNMSAVEKLRKLARAVRSSPQRRENWLREAELAGLKALILILDVRTRWSSTHHMLRRALDLREVVDAFTAKNRDFRRFELSNSDWDCIETVCGWLDVFQSATREMSATRTPMLSSTIAVFHGLQSRLRDALRSLPNSCDPAIRDGLVNAHRKLSDYYSRFDESPYGTWAALLDPRMSYEGLKFVFADDSSLLSNLEIMKTRLSVFYNENYAPLSTNSVASAQPAQSSAPTRSGFDFTSIFRRVPTQPASDELDAYFKMPPVDFSTCPVQWWFNHRFQFPHLCKLAFDVLGIPGSAVAVERVFSGGRDTISLRRASLKPKTIRMLMISKQKIRKERST